MPKVLAKVLFIVWFVVGISMLYYSINNASRPILNNQVVATQTLLVDDELDHINLRQHAQPTYAPDNLPFSVVSQNIDGWLPAVDLAPLPVNSRLWFKVNVRYQDAQNKDLTLLVGSTSLQHINVYALDRQGRIVSSFSSGTEHYASPPYLSASGYAFPFTIKQGQMLSLLISITDEGPLLFPLTLWDSAALKESTQSTLMWLCFSVGALMMLFGYFAITYLTQRSVLRFWFALSCLFVGLTVFFSQGLQFTLLHVQSNSTSLVICLFMLTLLPLCRVTHGLLPSVPWAWRALNYFLAALLLVCLVISNPYSQILLTISVILLYALYQFALIISRYSSRQRQVSGFLIVSWLLMSSVMGAEVLLYIGSGNHSPYVLATNCLLFLLGFTLLAIAIESKDRQNSLLQIKRHERDINGLNKFYDLFKHSAEGLFVSSIDGKLLSVNPAMCQLFGYPNEENMLSKVKHTRQLYAHSSEREILIGELLHNDRITGKEIRGLRQDGREIWMSMSVRLHEEEDGHKRLYGALFDISERKKSQVDLAYLSTHDVLTGVINRREYERLLQQAIYRLSQSQDSLSLLFLDLDHFKLVNDTCGHKAGDLFIREAASVLTKSIAGQGYLARLGSDEFAIILEAFNEDDGYLFGTTLLQAIQQHQFLWENHSFSLAISIGLVATEDDSMNAEHLTSMAEAACFVAKEKGRNQIHRYSPTDRVLQRHENEMMWVTRLNDALMNNGFVLYYQHCRPLNKSTPGSYIEVLLRLDDTTPINPGQFLPTAERYDLSARIDLWVIENTFAWLAENPSLSEQVHRCNINLSGHSLANKEIKLLILNLFEKFAIPYDKICFEITESIAILKMEDTLKFMKTFSELGCLFALDDFGSGFSSYSYLKNLPVHIVKIDGEFVRGILRDPIDMAMVSSFEDIAKALKIETVAEYVESADIMTQLGKMGIDYAQGNAVALPTPLSEFTPL